MKHLNNKFINRIPLPCLTFFAVTGIYMALYALFGFFPFGERSIAWCDMEQQYIPLLMELRNILRNGGSLLLGKGGGGMNFWGVFMFFVSSPLSLLAVFVPEEDMIYFVNLLTVLKLALGGAASSFALKKLFAKLPWSFNVILSVMYTVSGYVMMYYQNNMWLDMMIILPLLLISMFRLCKSGKWGFYAICLSSAMVLNFYISYMLVLFIVLSFGLMLRLCCEKENRGNRAVRFLTADICAALMTAVVWLPSLIQFTSSGRGESSAEFFGNSRFFLNWSDKASLLMCTSLILTAFVMMFVGRSSFRSGKPAFFGIMLTVMVIGAFIGPVNLLWHTGSYQAYPLRYGFIIIFLGLAVTAVLLSERSDKKPLSPNLVKALALCLLLFAIFIGVLLIYHNSDKLRSYATTLWVENNDAAILIGFGAVIAVAYAVIICLYRRGALSCPLASLFMTMLLLCECVTSFGVYVDGIVDVTTRFEQTMATNNKINDNELFRVKYTKRYFHSNMLEGMGYNSIGHYTSLTDKDFLFTAKQLGYSAYWMDISANGGTLITDAFLMNKYVMGIASDMNRIYEAYNSDDIIKIYSNPIVSDGAVISGKAPDEGFENAGRIESSELIAEALYGTKIELVRVEPYMYDNIKYTEAEGKSTFEIIDDSRDAYICYSFFSKGKNELYFNISGNYSTALREPYFNATEVQVNGKNLQANYPNSLNSGIIDMGTFENKYVSVKIKVNRDFTADEWGVYRLDAEQTAAAVASAETAHIKLEGNRIIITGSGREGDYVYIPFAFNGGFSARLNGKKAEILRAFGSFMAVKLENGENELILEFYPSGLKSGLAVSAVGAVIFAGLMLSRKKLPRISRKAEKTAEASVYLLSGTVFAVIYLLSIIIWLIL